VRLDGTLYRDGKYWLAEIPLLDGMTQGRTRAEALEMARDWVETMVGKPGFQANVESVSKDRFEIESSDVGSLVALLLRRQRQRSGLSLAEVAQRLGATSRNAYARYERGESVPTIEMFDRLLAAVSGSDFVIRESAPSGR
jgi:ribosome-binding protein aMBF1 (putative translation factor)